MASGDGDLRPQAAGASKAALVAPAVWARPDARHRQQARRLRGSESARGFSPRYSAPDRAPEPSARRRLSVGRGSPRLLAAASRSYADASKTVGKVDESPTRGWRSRRRSAQVSGADRVDHHPGAGHRRGVAGSRASREVGARGLSDVGAHQLRPDRNAFPPLAQPCHPLRLPKNPGDS